MGDANLKLKHLSTIANTVLNRCALKLDTSVDALVKEFEIAWKPEMGDYSRKLVEYSCSKVLKQKPFKIEESIGNSSFSRFTFDMILAWQLPSSSNEESYMECLGKEKEEKKVPLEVDTPHEDVSLFYCDIMPLLVDHEPAVKEDAFVWFTSLLPLSGDVTNAKFTFEALTAPTANIFHFPAYDKFLKEIDKCIKYLQKQETPKGVVFADDEFILHVEGTAGSRVVRHIGGESWPGKLTLTNYALYFEASGTLTYENALKIALSNNKEQIVKPIATGPWGAPLFDKAMLYECSEMTEGVVLEFPESASSTRRDHWLALTKEVILLHQFLTKHDVLSVTQVWEMHARTILGIVRLHAAREMLRMAPPLPRNFLIFTLFDELPKGDYVLEELVGTMKLTYGGDLCSGSSILRAFNSPRETYPNKEFVEKDIEKGTPLMSTPNNDKLSTLKGAVDEVRQEEKEIVHAKATTKGLKEEGVADSASVLLELLKPLRGSCIWFQQVLTWEKPGATLNTMTVILLVAYNEWIGKALAIGLLWAAFEMLQARRHRKKDKFNKMVVCTASDQTTLESIVSAQQGLRTAHDLVQQVNIAILKIYSILVSKAPKQANTVMMLMVGIAIFLMVVPVKYIIMVATVYLFAMTSRVAEHVMANDSGYRRLKEWWDSIPVIPVLITDDPAECNT